MKKILHKLTLSVVAGLLASSSFAQLDGTDVAPDFTGTDLNGNSHNLYDYLDAGKTVVIDVSATWCSPCWSYHQAHELRNLYDTYGPNGTDEVMVLFIEGDPSTTTADLNGTGTHTAGDWVTGTTYPIIVDASIGSVAFLDPEIEIFPDNSLLPVIKSFCIKEFLNFRKRNTLLFHILAFSVCISNTWFFISFYENKLCNSFVCIYLSWKWCSI